MIGIKQHDEMNRRLKSGHKEKEELQSQYDGELRARMELERDMHHLKEEVAALQYSEGTMREERSRILSVSLLRT
jgi:hypothetical protein